MEYGRENNLLIIEPIYPNEPDDGYFLKAVGEHYGHVVSVEVPSLLFLPDADCLANLRKFRELEINSARIPMTVGGLTFDRHSRGDIDVTFEMSAFDDRIAATGIVKVAGEDSTGFLRDFRAVLGEYQFTTD